MDTLPKGLQNIIGHIMCDNTLSSWRIYGDQYITLSLKFVKGSSVLGNGSSSDYLPDKCPANMESAYRKKSPSVVGRDKKRQEHWYRGDFCSEPNDATIDTLGETDTVTLNENSNIATVQTNNATLHESGYASTSTPYSTDYDHRHNKTVEFNLAMQCPVEEFSIPEAINTVSWKPENQQIVIDHNNASSLNPLLSSVPTQTYQSSMKTDSASQSDVSPPKNSSTVHIQTDLTEASISCQTECITLTDNCAQTLPPTNRQSQTPRWSSQDKRPQTVPIMSSDQGIQCCGTTELVSTSTMISTELLPHTVDEASGFEGSRSRHIQTDIPKMKQKCVGTRQSMFAVYQEQLHGRMKSPHEMMVELDEIVEHLQLQSDSIT